MASPLCDANGVVNGGVSTPFGCLPFTGGSGDGKTMIEVLSNWGVGIAALVCVFAIIAASFQITTAAGDAKKVQAGKELLTAAIGGIILVTTGIVILNFLGVSVLGLDLLGFTV